MDKKKAAGRKLFSTYYSDLKVFTCPIKAIPEKFFYCFVLRQGTHYITLASLELAM